MKHIALTDFQTILGGRPLKPEHKALRRRGHTFSRGGVLSDSSQFHSLDRGSNATYIQLSREHLEALLDVMSITVSGLTIPHLLQDLLPTIRRVIQCDAASIALFDPEDLCSFREWAIEYPGNSGRLQKQHANSADGGAWLTKLVQAGEPLRLTDAKLDNHVLPWTEGFKALCHLPLVGRTPGVLTLASLTEATFADCQLPFLKQIARQIAVAVENAVAHRRIGCLEEKLACEGLYLEQEILNGAMFEEIVGSSTPLLRTLEHVARVAPTESTVLISGESGTGKELIARAIHKRSRRANCPFVRVNCAAIPPSLIASELFGHEKGAFTGASERRLGRFELANGGTIFLDEVGDIPAETQIALLRVLQEREFERIGGAHPVSVDVRVVAATNQDLKAAVDAGTFRLDLFYRLNVFPVRVPSLRERAGDIPLLTKYFINRYAAAAGKKIVNVEKKTIASFQSYDWPGNIRELQNVVERAVILCDRETFSVDESWIQCEAARGPEAPSALTQTLANREKEMIEAALEESCGRIFGPSGAAVKLGIPRSTLESKIKSLNINKHRFKVEERDLTASSRLSARGNR